MSTNLKMQPVRSSELISVQGGLDPVSILVGGGFALFGFGLGVVIGWLTDDSDAEPTDHPSCEEAGGPCGDT